jgi:6-bladed beta-propeller protein
MPDTARLRIMAAWTVVALMGIFATCARAQTNPYRMLDNWAQLPPGRTLGFITGVDVDQHGHVWVLERCGADTCVGSNLDPILEFDASGTFLKSFGAGMFVFPHGFHLDKDSNVWTTDGNRDDGKGETVIEFSPAGKVLLTLGKPGVAGDGPDTFNAPSDVLVAPNGDIFVADGHGGDTNARIVKFSKDGKFIKAWGKKGSGPGEFDIPHSMAMDSTGRLFVADRNNNRIQIFSQEGEFLGEWKQFGMPSSVFIDSRDNLYVTDAQSTPKVNPGFEQGIRIGSTRDGVVKILIPPQELPAGAITNRPLAPGEKPVTVTVCVAADTMGNLYAGEGGTRNLRKYVKITH